MCLTALVAQKKRFTTQRHKIYPARPALSKPQPVLALTSSRPSRPPQPWGKHPHSAQPKAKRASVNARAVQKRGRPAQAARQQGVHPPSGAGKFQRSQACSKSTGHPSNRNSDGQSTSARPPTKAQRDAMRRTLIDMSGPSVAFRPGTSPRFVGQYSGRSEAQSPAQELRGMA